MQASFTLDGIPVTTDYFMAQLNFTFESSFGLVEYAGRSSGPRLAYYEVPIYNGRLKKFFPLKKLNSAITEALESGSTR